MAQKIMVELESWEWSALKRLARVERRTPEAQAETLLIDALVRSGFLKAYTPVPPYDNNPDEQEKK
jgi:hypothetical protein